MTTARAALEGWLVSLEASQRPLTTRKAYGADVGRLVAFLELAAPEAAADVRALDLAICRRWLAALAATGVGPSSRSRATSSGRAWGRSMLRAKLIESSPFEELELPKVPPRTPAYLSAEDAAKLCNGSRDPLLRAIVEALYSSAARVSELCGLTLEDVALARGEARVIGKGAKERIVYLGHPAIAALEAWLRVRPDVPSRALFVTPEGEPLGVRSVQKMIKAAGAELLPGRKVHPHLFRHAASTHMLEGGAGLRELQEMLGHAKVTTTQLYTHVSPKHLAKTYAAAHPLARVDPQLGLELGDVAGVGHRPELPPLAKTKACTICGESHERPVESWCRRCAALVTRARKAGIPTGGPRIAWVREQLSAGVATRRRGQ